MTYGNDFNERMKKLVEVPARKRGVINANGLFEEIDERDQIMNWQLSKYVKPEEEVDEMSEGTSRYSIVENLTKEKSLAEQQIKQAKMALIQKELEFKRANEQEERNKKVREEDLSVFKQTVAIDIEFQTARATELDKAIESIKDISKTVEKKEKE